MEFLPLHYHKHDMDCFEIIMILDILSRNVILSYIFLLIFYYDSRREFNYNFYSVDPRIKHSHE